MDTPTLHLAYEKFLGEQPLRRGHGPWWLTLAVNIAPKARPKSQIWFHSNPDLQLAVANHTERGFSVWRSAIEIGPFKSEKAAHGFFQLWGKNSSKDRGSRVLWAMLLHDVYKTREGIGMFIADPETLVLSPEELSEFQAAQRQAQLKRRGRMGDVYTRRTRVWEMERPIEQRISAGGGYIRREILKKKAK